MPTTTLGEHGSGWTTLAANAPRNGTLTITAVSTSAYVYIQYGAPGTPSDQMRGGWKIIPGFTPLPLDIPIVKGDTYAITSTGPTVVTWSFA